MSDPAPRYTHPGQRAPPGAHQPPCHHPAAPVPPTTPPPQAPAPSPPRQSQPTRPHPGQPAARTPTTTTRTHPPTTPAPRPTGPLDPSATPAPNTNRPPAPHRPDPARQHMQSLCTRMHTLSNIWPTSPAVTACSWISPTQPRHPPRDKICGHSAPHRTVCVPSGLRRPLRGSASAVPDLTLTPRGPAGEVGNGSGK
jgi:hypothetical protein